MAAAKNDSGVSSNDEKANGEKYQYGEKAKRKRWR